MRAWKIGVGLVSVGVIAAILINLPGHAGGEAREGWAKLGTTTAPATASGQSKARQGGISGTPQEEALSSQVQELVATREPEKLYQAYLLLADCDEFNRDHDRLIYDEKIRNKENILGYRQMTEQEKQHDSKRCGAMTERERQSRIDYLSIAAKAAVPGAAIDFLREGPFGDNSALTTRPNDPLVLEWKAVARVQLVSEAELGKDLAALDYLASEEFAGSKVFEKNVRLAYRYYLANGLIEGDIVGPDSDIAKFFAEDSQLLNAVGKELSTAERSVEMAAAQQIARNFRDRRKASR